MCSLSSSSYLQDTRKCTSASSRNLATACCDYFQLAQQAAQPVTDSPVDTPQAPKPVRLRTHQQHTTTMLYTSVCRCADLLSIYETQRLPEAYMREVGHSQDFEEQSLQHRVASVNLCVNVLNRALELPTIPHKLLHDSPAGVAKARQPRWHHTSMCCCCCWSSQLPQLTVRGTPNRMPSTCSYSIHHTHRPMYC